MKTGKMKRRMSGLMAIVTLMSSMTAPYNVLAKSVEEVKIPFYKQIRNLLDEKETVRARALGVDLGSNFDVKIDFSNIEIPDNEAVKVTFEEAKNEEGEDFSTEKLDVYDAVYYVEPLLTDHPKYQISRKLVVKEPGTEIDLSVYDEEEEDEDVSVQETEEAAGVEEFQIPIETMTEDVSMMTDAEVYAETEETGLMTEVYAETEAFAEEECLAGVESMDLSGETVEIIPEADVQEFQETEHQEVSTEITQEPETDVMAVLPEEVIEAISEIVQDTGEMMLTEQSEDAETEMTADDVDAEISSQEVISEAPTPLYEEVTEKKEETELQVTADLQEAEETEDSASEQQTEAVQQTEQEVAEEAVDMQVLSEAGDEQAKFQAKLKIVTIDADTKQLIKIPNTEFRVYDLDHECYVEQVTSYPQVYTHTSYFTDSQGSLIMPRKMEAGNYRIEEVQAPAGYAFTGNAMQVTISPESIYEVDATSGDNLIEVAFEHQAVKGKVNITAKGEHISGFEDGAFIYEMGSLAGVEYELIAAEDIYSSDYQLGDDGKRKILYTKGASVMTVQTDENGIASAENLPMGSYEIRQKDVPEGYLKNDISKTVTFEYQDQGAALIQQDLLFSCDRQVLEICATQHDADNHSFVEGAVFGLYPAQDIKTADGKVILKADSLIARAESGEDGKAIFRADLVPGKYYVKQLKAPSGYVSSDEVIPFSVKYMGYEMPVFQFNGMIQSEITTMELSVTDKKTGTSLSGASIYLLDKKGNKMSEWTSEREHSLTMKRMKAGETYALHVEFAPYGYLRTSKDVEFTVEDTAEVQKLQVELDVPTALLIINSKGQFLSSVDANSDNARGKKVTFNVYAAEDIKSADGTSEDYYKKDDLVTTITTNDKGVAQAADLPVGKYYTVEVPGENGYQLDDAKRFADLSYRDQDTPVVTYSEEWQCERARVSVKVSNVNRESQQALQGAVFGLYSDEAVKTDTDTQLYKKDQLIEQQTTDKNGNLSFSAELPVNKGFYVKEITAADGYVTSDQTQSFQLEYKGSDTEVMPYEFIFEDDITLSQMAITDQSAESKVIGAQMKLTSKEGDVIDTWTSGKEPHEVKGLAVGKNYILINTKPAKGYVTAKKVKFTVKNVATAQKQEMLTDVTKLQISKTDASGKNQVKGAGLVILDKNDQVVEKWTSDSQVHYVEKLPVGSYTIREETTAKGYVMRGDVSFELADSAKVQYVSMSNETAKGKLILNVSEEEGKPLMGAEFELRGSDGKAVDTLKTDAAGHAESKLQTIADFSNGTMGDTLKYYLVQTKCVQGYSPDTEKHEVTFNYADQNTPIIEVTMDLKNPVDTKNPQAPGSATTTQDVPQTGDTTNFLFPILMMLSSVACIIGILTGRKRRTVK